MMKKFKMMKRMQEDQHYDEVDVPRHGDPRGVSGCIISRLRGTSYVRARG